MLRRAFVLFVVSLLGVVAACRPETPQGMPGGLGGAPVPPFEGTPPEDPYVFEGTPGTYGGTITFSTISDPKSWNPVTSSETSTTYITSGPLYYPLLGQDNQKQEINNGLCSSYESTPDHPPRARCRQSILRQATGCLPVRRTTPRCRSV